MLMTGGSGKWGKRRWLSDTLCEISGLLHDEAAAGQTPIIYIYATVSRCFRFRDLVDNL